MSNWEVHRDLFLYRMASELFDLTPYMIKEFHWYGMDLTHLLPEGADIVCGRYIDEVGIELEKKRCVYWQYDIWPIHFRDKVQLESIGIYEDGEFYMHFSDEHDNWWEIT